MLLPCGKEATKGGGAERRKPRVRNMQKSCLSWKMWMVLIFSRVLWMLAVPHFPSFAQGRGIRAGWGAKADWTLLCNCCLLKWCDHRWALSTSGRWWEVGVWEVCVPARARTLFIDRDEAWGALAVFSLPLFRGQCDRIQALPRPDGEEGKGYFWCSRSLFLSYSFPFSQCHMLLSFILIKIYFRFPCNSFSHVRWSCFCAIGMTFNWYLNNYYLFE